MATLESLPPDQRAVLALVLQRGHSFDDIAELLSIDRAAVRERALSAMDALGPETEVDAPRRALITDYLLGQLPPRVADTVRDGLASSPDQRAWARVLSSDLAALAAKALPVIPSGSARAAESAAPVAAPPESAAEPSAGSAPPAPPSTETRRERTPAGEAASSTTKGPAAAAGQPKQGLAGEKQPSSRLGGAILLGITLLIALIVVIVIVANSGGSSSHSSTPAAGTTTASSSTTTSRSGTASAKPVAQVNLTSPSGNSKVGGVAIVVKQGATEGLVIRAQGVPANTGRDAYAVWLSNGAGDERILGFVNPAVTASGVLQTAGALPANVAHFKQLLVTRESQARPKTHGTIVLQGALSLTP